MRSFKMPIDMSQWKLQPDAIVDAAEAQAIVAVLKRSERHAAAAAAAVDALGAIAIDAVTAGALLLF